LDKTREQLLNRQLSHLRVQLLHAKLSEVTPDWRRLRFTPPYNKFYYICDGNGWVQIGNEHYRPAPGELLFMPGGIEQSFSVADGKTYTMYWCHFNTNVSLGRLFQLLGIPTLVKLKNEALLKRHFQELVRHFNEKGPTSSGHIQSQLFGIISLFLDEALAHRHVGASSITENKLLASLRYIDANLSKEITIEQLSDQAHFHPNYFIRIFKLHMGMPPMKYIHELRLEKAQHLLASSDMTIAEIAHRSGFNDVPYFSASFKKHVGVTPSNYRNVMQYERGNQIPAETIG